MKQTINGGNPAMILAYIIKIDSHIFSACAVKYKINTISRKGMDGGFDIIMSIIDKRIRAYCIQYDWTNTKFVASKGTNL